MCPEYSSPHVCSVCKMSEDGITFPETVVNRWLLTAMWVLGTKPSPSEGGELRIS